MLLACGPVYIISGILCIGMLKRSRKQKAMSREQTARDLENPQSYCKGEIFYKLDVKAKPWQFLCKHGENFMPLRKSRSATIEGANYRPDFLHGMKFLWPGWRHSKD